MGCPTGLHSGMVHGVCSPPAKNTAILGRDFSATDTFLFGGNWWEIWRNNPHSHIDEDLGRESWQWNIWENLGQQGLSWPYLQDLRRWNMVENMGTDLQTFLHMRVEIIFASTKKTTTRTWGFSSHIRSNLGIQDEDHFDCQLVESNLSTSKIGLWKNGATTPMEEFTKYGKNGFVSRVTTARRPLLSLRWEVNCWTQQEYYK